LPTLKSDFNSKRKRFATLHFQKSEIFSGDITAVLRFRLCKLSSQMQQVALLKTAMVKLPKAKP